MKQSSVADVLQPRGCAIQAFEDHPNFFGNWRACFSRGQRGFEIASDHRDGWMDLWEYPPGGPGRCLREVRSQGFDEAEELSVFASWLDEVLAG